MVNSKKKDAKPKSQSKKIFKPTKNFKASLILSAVGAFFFIGALTQIGTGGSAIFSGLTILFCLVAGYFSIPALIKEVNDKVKGKEFIKSIIAVSIVGLLVLGSIIAMIADPIALNKRCSAFTSIDEMSLDETSICKNRISEIEAQAEAEKNAADEALAKAKDECKAKDYDWNSSERRCNSDEEQQKENAKKKAKEECKAKKYNWDYAKDRCNTDAEQQADNQKKAEEEAKRAEANKTTTYTGKDHDDNDKAGRYTKIMNACWDELEAFWPKGVAILDSDDGYPITYSVTLKGDGTLVEGSMIGTYRTGQGKIKDLNCIYKNGSAKVAGIEN